MRGTKKPLSKFLSFGLFALEVAALYLVLYFLTPTIQKTHLLIPLVVALIPILAFYAHRLEKTFSIPYFVWAIGLGYLFSNHLTVITAVPESLKLMVEIFGILIIFGGGLEVSFKSFKRLLLPIFSLSIIGALLTALLFSLGLQGIAMVTALPLSIGTIGLLGAMLCSTDPAAIVPTLQKLHLKNPDDAVVAISESAVNDVVGTILTSIFGALVLGGLAITSLGGLWSSLFSLNTLFDFLKELLIGSLVGSLAFLLLKSWKSSKHMDLAGFPFFIGVALVAYTLSAMWGGSGYLAAFITGLLFEVQNDFKEIEHFFTRLVDGFIKPSVFILLGALITMDFWTYAWIGILVSLAFIFIIRPIVVTASLGIFALSGRPFAWRDLLFFDAIRETGVIPAVLLVAYSSLLPDGRLAFAIGSWVIVSTLIILPTLTDWWAKRVKAAT